MTIESENIEKHAAAITAKLEKHYAAQAAAVAAWSAYRRFYVVKQEASPAGQAAYAAYQAASAGRQATQAALDAALDARRRALKKLQAAQRKAWRSA